MLNIRFELWATHSIDIKNEEAYSNLKRKIQNFKAIILLFTLFIE